VWDLDKLIYRNEEATIRALQPQITGGQRRIINRIQILYGVRRRLITEIVLDEGEGDVRSLLRRSLKLQEATAQLDGLTGGGFSTVSAERGAEDHKYMLLGRPGPALSLDDDVEASTLRAQRVARRKAGIPRIRLSAESSSVAGERSRARNHTAAPSGRAPASMRSFIEERKP